MVAEDIYPQYSAEQYLDYDLNSENIRLEYDRGTIYAMAGASPNHIRITGNLHFILNAPARAAGCITDSSDEKVGLPGESYFYPDFVITCMPKDYEIRVKGTYVLTNPFAVFEVSSSTTKNLDRTRKMTVCRAIPSVQHYMIVMQNQILITHWFRTDTGWQETVYTHIDQIITFGDFALPLAQLYEGVKWNED